MPGKTLNPKPLNPCQGTEVEAMPAAGPLVRAATMSWVASAFVIGFGGLGFRVQGSGFRVQGSGFRVQGLGFRGVGHTGTWA